MNQIKFSIFENERFFSSTKRMKWSSGKQKKLQRSHYFHMIEMQRYRTHSVIYQIHMYTWWTCWFDMNLMSLAVKFLFTSRFVFAPLCSRLKKTMLMDTLISNWNNNFFDEKFRYMKCKASGFCGASKELKVRVSPITWDLSTQRTLVRVHVQNFDISTLRTRTE